MKSLLLVVAAVILAGCGESNKTVDRHSAVLKTCSANEELTFNSDSTVYSAGGIVLACSALRARNSHGSKIIAPGKMHGYTIYPAAARRTEGEVSDSVILIKKKLVYYLDVHNFQKNDSDPPKDVKYREVFIINYPLVLNKHKYSVINHKIKKLFYDSQVEIINRRYEAYEDCLVDSSAFIKSKSAMGPNVIGGIIDVKSVSVYIHNHSGFLSIVSGNLTSNEETELGLFVNPTYFDLQSMEQTEPERMLGKDVSNKVDVIINNCFLQIPRKNFHPLRKKDWDFQFSENGFFLTTTELEGVRFIGQVWAYVPYCSISTP